ncbi:transposase (fragment) [Microcystis sp. T1-4]
MREIEESKLIFMDESGVNLALLRLYARALIVQKSRERKPQKRGKYFNN